MAQKWNKPWEIYAVESLTLNAFEWDELIANVMLMLLLFFSHNFYVANFEPMKLISAMALLLSVGTCNTGDALSALLLYRQQ